MIMRQRRSMWGKRMFVKARVALGAMIALAALGGCAHTPESSAGLSDLHAIARVDERFQSYNVEMVEVTGGRFWAPYGGPPGEVYRMRPPKNLADPRLRALAAQLGPAYMRVSGTWANATYLEAEGEHLTAPPAGYDQVLTRAQWRGVLDFANAVGAKVGVSFAVSAGARDANGAWRTEQAQRLLDLTREAGGEISFAEFINEPNAAALGRLPEGYADADYTRDFGIFHAWAREAAPHLQIVGPSSVGEGAFNGDIPVAFRGRMLLTENLMKASPNTLDAVSYHFYGDVSQRCANIRPTTADKAAALTPAWLDLTLRDWTYYAGLRDRFEPGDPVWVSETAQAACGGSPWAASFLDTFRYLNQLGLLAQHDVQVVMHNTLAASDYALINEDTLEPRPNYWAAVLWRRTMGTVVLSPPQSPSPELRLYAHCLRGTPGGVALLAINLGDTPMPIDAGAGARIWTMQAQALEDEVITVNGRTPRLTESGALEGLEPEAASGEVSVPAKSIAFIAAPRAHNAACR